MVHTPEEEAHWLTLAKTTRSDEAYANLISANEGFLYKLIGRIRPTAPYDIKEEALQEGRIQLFTAIGRYELPYKVRLLTFAGKPLYAAVRGALKAKGVIHIPKGALRANREHAERLGNQLSLDSALEKSFHEIIGEEAAIEEELHTRTLEETVADFLTNNNTRLNEREQYVLRTYYGIPASSEGHRQEQQELTLDEIGKELGITRERVRQIRDKALQKARAAKPLRPFRELRN